METNRTFRSNVYHMAWELYKTTGKSWPVCLSKAWTLHRLIRNMQQGIVSFAYEKADGSMRKARGTLKDIASRIKGTGRETFQAIRYYDVDAKGFRSFRINNFITTY